MEKSRAVIYNRCSTEEESQKDALIKQVQESKDCVREQDWFLVDTYVEAKSGTTVKGRTEYNRLFDDLETDKFDVIVIKSQDRLMRNTKDWYLFLDRMQRNHKQLYMYLEHKFYTPDDALITGIKAILAEEYSRELSRKINNAHRNRQRNGDCFVITGNTYGYRKLPDKSIVVDEDEAEMVRLIYKLAVNGYGTHSSAEILFQKGYRNRTGNMLTPSSIRKIIRNPLYKGDVVQNRQHYDFESKQILKNPKEEWVIHENAIPAIVDAELFEEANQCMDRRKTDRNQKRDYGRSQSSGRHALSGKLVCGLCHSPFYRTLRKKKGEKEGCIAEWKCSNYLRNGRKNQKLRRKEVRKTPQDCDTGCDNVHLDEKKLYQTLEEVCRDSYQELNIQKEELLNETLVILRKALERDSESDQRQKLEASLEKLLSQKETLLEKLLDDVVADADFKRKSKELDERMEKVREQLNELREASFQSAQMEKRMDMIRKRLEEGMVEQAQITDMLTNVARIIVAPDYLEIYFDSWAVIGIEEQKSSVLTFGAKEAGKMMTIQVPLKCSTSHQPLIEKEKEEVLEYMKKSPKITAKKIAEKMDVNLSLVRRRIRELKTEGKIYYKAGNGKGYWVVRTDEYHL